MIERLKHGQLIFILIAMAYFFLMLGNGMISLTHPDEVFYIQTAKEMMTHKSWLVPYIFDLPQFEKPIFSYWLFILAIKVFGMTAFAARFVPALFGMVGVLATYWLAMMLFNSKRTAFLSATVLMTSVIYLALSRAVLTDMVFSIWVVLALCFFYYGYTDARRKTLGILMCFILSGVAVLTKGLLGFIFPAGVIFGYLLYKKDLAFLKNGVTVIGFLVFLAINLPWHILMVKWYGSVFISEYWNNVHLRRIFEAEHLKSKTWYFYLMTVIGGIFPWSLFILPAGYLSLRNLRRSNPHKDQMAFLLFLIAVVFAVVQIAQSKLASYVFPVFPAIAIIIGYYFDRVISGGELLLEKMARIFFYIMAAFLAIASAASIIVGQRYAEFIGDMKTVYVFMGLALACAAAIVFFNQQRKLTAAAGATACIIAVVLVSASTGYHNAEPWVSCKLICDALKKVDSSDSALLCSKFYVRGVRFYTDRKTAVIDINGSGFFSPHPIPFLSDDSKVRDFLSSQSVTYCIVKESNKRDIERLTAGQFLVEKIDEIGGKYLLKVQKIKG
ncbi:MAG TPA: phospholipid carrier-dependent glycosyltransferase [Candidatus Omnitrophota bacterium]|nr:phospholipid carrier-dependent glycosyltransferase [Candidatus Omnitrophota bacterium]HPD85063.1 phospholipid carrier-dependent glycosyltransferase [Candidatus Omnitrophota bacterium]HRZ03921.1 phospholipid carrier-dependent glycosyltransferase [Candidatus Omnitrophota bacterium]